MAKGTGTAVDAVYRCRPRFSERLVSTEGSRGDVEDDVFAEGTGSHLSLLTPSNRGSRLTRASSGASARKKNARKYLFPSLGDGVAPCITHSPARRELQTKGLEDAIADATLIGRGSFGSVILGTWKGKRVAVKIIANSCHKAGEKGRSNSIVSELNGTQLSHKNLVKIYDVFASKDHNTLVVMEFVGKCNLHTILETCPERIDSQFMHRCFVDIAEALAYIHEQGILHLDVKPGNVFVTSDGCSKLGDFGCSRQVTSSFVQEGILVGTSGYQAPEFLRCQQPTVKCDTYSFGVLMWQVIAREQPFKSMHPHTVIYQVVTMKRRPGFNNAPLQTPYKRVYERCWQQSPRLRPSMREVAKSLQQEKVPGRRKSMRL